MMKAFEPRATILTNDKLRLLKEPIANVWVVKRKDAYVLNIDIPMNKDSAVALCDQLTQDLPRQFGDRMSCEKVRQLLTKPANSQDNQQVQEALQHLLHCNACFIWSFNECQKIRAEKNRRT